MSAVNTVVEKISDIQKAQPQVLRVPVPPPIPGDHADGADNDDRDVYAKTLDELQRPLKNDAQELLKSRFLCKGGGLLLVGPTGIGKSSLSMQMMISWALGRSLFGIEPARPITSLLIQAENDDGDLAEMRDGVFSGLNLADADRELACSRIFVVQENTRTSEEFFNETVRPMLQEIKPDLLWIDPALAYLGGENNSQQAVGAFLRNQLNPLLTEFNCGAVVIHHTNKPYNGPEKRGPVDFAYLGGGSAEWANWSRAILTLQKVKDTSVFELRAAKRGNRLGWKEADGTTTAHNRFIAHNKEPGTILWIDVEPELVDGLGKGNGQSEEDVLKHVPLDRPIAKNTLISICSKNGLGMTKARNFIDVLVSAGRLCEWQRQRKSSHPEKYLTRFARPADLDDEAILTTFLTGISACEKHREHDTKRSSQLHGPLGPVKIGCEDREDLEGVALLPVPETKACENQPCEDGPPKPPACVLSHKPGISPVTPPATVPVSPPCSGPGPAIAVTQAPTITTITGTNPIKYEQEPAQSTTLASNEKRLPPTYEAALLELGRILTAEDSFTPWMSLRKISGQCNKHWRRLPRLDFSIRALTCWAIDCVRDCGEVRRKGMKVAFKTERRDPKRGEDILLSFRRLNPDGSLS